MTGSSRRVGMVFAAVGWLSGLVGCQSTPVADKKPKAGEKLAPERVRRPNPVASAALNTIAPPVLLATLGPYYLFGGMYCYFFTHHEVPEIRFSRGPEARGGAAARPQRPEAGKILEARPDRRETDF